MKEGELSWQFPAGGIEGGEIRAYVPYGLFGPVQAYLDVVLVR